MKAATLASPGTFAADHAAAAGLPLLLATTSSSSMRGGCHEAVVWQGGGPAHGPASHLACASPSSFFLSSFFGAQVHDPELRALVGPASYLSITYRLFKLPGTLEAGSEDYGQAARYLVSCCCRRLLPVMAAVVAAAGRALRCPTLHLPLAWWHACGQESA